MTETRDFDRLTRAWMDLMPVEAPDRVIASILDATERVPQARRPRILIDWRRRADRVSVLAIAAGLVVALAGIAMVIKPAPNVGPEATASPSPGASTGAIPAALRSTWLGAPREVPGVPARPTSELDFSSQTISINGTAVRGTVEASGDELSVSSHDDAICAATARGRYRWGVGPLGSRLRLTVVDDPCALRAAAYGGDWYHPACRDRTLHATCWGDLEAGTYPTVAFAPRQAPGPDPVAVFGALTFAVPAGWSIAHDHTTDLLLLHAADAAAEAAGSAASVAEIQAWTFPAANAQTEPCAYGVAPEVGTDAGSLTNWLHGLSGLSAEAPRPITIGGRPARMVDLRLAPSWTNECGGSRGRYLIAERAANASGVGTEPKAIGINEQTRLRAIFVDLGSGVTVMVLIEAPDPATFDTFVAEAMPIVESFTFK
jgi:hypothetical protein